MVLHLNILSVVYSLASPNRPSWRRWEITDTHLIDYLSLLLSRFIHMDARHHLRDYRQGKQLHEVVEMLLKSSAAAGRPDSPRVSAHRRLHSVLDRLYPDLLMRRLKSMFSKDQLLTKHCPGQASLPSPALSRTILTATRPPCLRRLSKEFELRVWPEPGPRRAAKIQRDGKQQLID